MTIFGTSGYSTTPYPYTPKYQPSQGANPPTQTYSTYQGRPKSAKQVKCYNCKELEHYARECPKKSMLGLLPRCQWWMTSDSISEVGTGRMLIDYGCDITIVHAKFVKDSALTGDMGTHSRWWTLREPLPLTRWPKFGLH